MCILNWPEVPTTPCTWELAGLVKTVNHFTGAITQIEMLQLNPGHLDYGTIFKSLGKTVALIKQIKMLDRIQGPILQRR